LPFILSSCKTTLHQAYTITR